MDSDSSGDEQASFTTTDVLLGYASKPETEDPISQLGGHPSWLHETSPSATLARCLICNDLMSLLLQLHADLPERFTGHDRRLHVFSCRRKTCRRKAGSVRALRSTRVDPEEQARMQEQAEEKAKRDAEAEAEAKSRVPKQQQQSFLGNDLFGGSKPAAPPSGGNSAKNPFAMGGPGANALQAASANPFSLSSTSSLASKAPQKPVSVPTISTPAPTPASDLTSTFAEKARISQPPSSTPSADSKSEPQEPWPQDLSALKTYPRLHLDADYEALGEGPPAPEQKVQIMDVDEGEGSSSSNAKNSVDDATADMSMDKAFQKFADRLWHNPEQVLRYEFEGRPLLYSDRDAVGKALAGGQQGKGVIVGGGGGRGGGNKGKGTGAGTGIPGCRVCGAARVFECQLTPYAITELEAEEDALEGMEWGTIIVGVCSKDCLPGGVALGKVGYVEEWVGVQWEESKK